MKKDLSVVQRTTSQQWRDAFKRPTAGYLMLTLLQDCEFQVEMRCGVCKTGSLMSDEEPVKS